MRRSRDAVGRPYQQVHRAQCFMFQPESLANAAFDAVTVGRQRSVLSRDHDPETRAARLAPLEEESETLQGTAPPLAQQALEMRFLAQPAGRIQPEALAARGY